MGSDNPKTNEQNQHGPGNPPDHDGLVEDLGRIILLRIHVVSCGGDRLIVYHPDARVLVVVVVVVVV